MLSREWQHTYLKGYCIWLRSKTWDSSQLWCLSILLNSRFSIFLVGLFWGCYNSIFITFIASNNDYVWPFSRICKLVETTCPQNRFSIQSAELFFWRTLSKLESKDLFSVGDFSEYNQRNNEWAYFTYEIKGEMIERASEINTKKFIFKNDRIQEQSQQRTFLQWTKVGVTRPVCHLCFFHCKNTE